MSTQHHSSEPESATRQSSPSSQETVQAGLDTAVGALISDFGEEAVSVEVTAVALEELQAKIGPITEALESKNPSPLRLLSRPALGYLRAMEQVTEEAAMQAFIARESPPTVQAEAILRLWATVRANSAAFTGMLSQLGPISESLFDVDEDTVRRVRDRLEPRALELRKRQITLLESYEPTLQGLLRAYTAGRQIADDIKVLAQVETFRDTLNLLARELPSSRRSTVDELGILALRYMPVVRTWRDMRLLLQGRINHWTDIQWNDSLDLERSYPQVELRLFSYSKEILYIRDDIDDILRLGVRLVSRVTNSIQLLLDSGAKMDPGLIEDLSEELRQLDDSGSTLRLRLGDRTTTSSPQDTEGD